MGFSGTFNSLRTDKALIPADDDPADESEAAGFRRQSNRTEGMTVAGAARTRLTGQRKHQAAGKPSKHKDAVIVPSAAPPAGIPFPGGIVTAADDGQMAVAIDPRT